MRYSFIEYACECGIQSMAYGIPMLSQHPISSFGCLTDNVCWMSRKERRFFSPYITFSSIFVRFLSYQIQWKTNSLFEMTKSSKFAFPSLIFLSTQNALVLVCIVFFQSINNILSLYIIMIMIIIILTCRAFERCISKRRN